MISKGVWAQKRVLAFYYTWYGTPQVTGRWLHWNEGGHNPEAKTFGGLPDTGTTHHPEKLYDSQDSSLIRQHLKMCEAVGIDGLIATWWGIGDYHDQAFRRLLEEAQKTRSPVRLTIYYERVPDSQDRVSSTINDFRYLLNQYADHPSFFRWQGLPVFFVYGRAMGQLSRAQWAEVIQKVKALHPCLFIGDSLDPTWLEFFDGLHEYNPVGAVLEGALLEERARKYVSAVKSSGKISTVTVLPGYDDSNIGRPHPIVVDRENTRLYRRMWQSAINARPDWVLICSFNEWHEGSEIEPSVELGDQYLRITKDFSQLFHTGRRILWRSPRSVKGTIQAEGESLIGVWEEPGVLYVENLVPATGRILLDLPEWAPLWVTRQGRDKRPWRLLFTSNVKGPFPLSLAPLGLYGVWRRDRLASSGKNSPAQSAQIGLRWGLSSSFPSEEPETYRVYPSGNFPLNFAFYNGGSQALRNGYLEIYAPEGWQGERQKVFEVLPPGGSVKGSMVLKVPANANLGESYLIIGCLTFPLDRQTLAVQNSIEVLPEVPLEIGVKYLEAERLQVLLRNRFEGVNLPVELKLDPGQGRSVDPPSRVLVLRQNSQTTFKVLRSGQSVPPTSSLTVIVGIKGFGVRRTFLDRATVFLGFQNQTYQLEQVEWEDGRTLPVNREGGPARQAIPHPEAEVHYVYFRLSKPMVPGIAYITVEYLDEGTGAFRLQYDSLDPQAPLEGAYKEGAEVPLGNSGQWKRVTLSVPDARFEHRQNGGSDFRLAVWGNLLLRSVTVSKWP